MGYYLGAPMYGHNSHDAIAGVVNFDDFADVPNILDGGVAVSRDNATDTNKEKQVKLIPFDPEKGFFGFIDATGLRPSCKLATAIMSGTGVPVIASEDLTGGDIGLDAGGLLVNADSENCVYTLNGIGHGLMPNPISYEKGETTEILSYIIDFRNGGAKKS